MRRKLTTALTLLAAVLLVGCGAGGATGTLEIRANGEDFVRQGFESKDGWAITFDHVYVTLADITAYQSDPPYDPHDGGELQADVSVGLGGVHTVDLAEGGEDADPILVGEVEDAPVGHYNAISWEMPRADGGPADGYSLAIVGTAEKDGRTVDFRLELETEYAYLCGEYVGDERKGVLAEDGTADVEMTFHFDHIFGDAGTPADDALNVDALGFEPLAAVSEDGVLDADLASLQSALSAEDYQALVEILPTLGHVGEGHCHCEVR